MRESPATAIREWALGPDSAGIGLRELEAVERAGLDVIFLPEGQRKTVKWITYWLFVAEAMETT